MARPHHLLWLFGAAASSMKCTPSYLEFVAYRYERRAELIAKPRTRFYARRSSPQSNLSLHVFSQSAIDTGSVGLFGFGISLEPADNIGIQTKRQLLFDWFVKQTTLSRGPVEEFRSVRRVYGAIR